MLDKDLNTVGHLPDIALIAFEGTHYQTLFSFCKNIL